MNTAEDRDGADEPVEAVQREEGANGHVHILRDEARRPKHFGAVAIQRQPVYCVLGEGGEGERKGESGRGRGKGGERRQEKRSGGGGERDTGGGKEKQQHDQQQSFNILIKAKQQARPNIHRERRNMAEVEKNVYFVLSPLRC